MYYAEGEVLRHCCSFADSEPVLILVVTAQAMSAAILEVAEQQMQAAGPTTWIVMKYELEELPDLE